MSDRGGESDSVHFKNLFSVLVSLSSSFWSIICVVGHNRVSNEYSDDRYNRTR